MVDRFGCRKLGAKKNRWSTSLVVESFLGSFWESEKELYGRKVWYPAFVLAHYTINVPLANAFMVDKVDSRNALR